MFGSAAAICRTRSTDQFGPERPDELLALLAHALRHDDADAVALEPADQGDADPGVARGRLADGGVGAELAVPFGALDHGQGDAVLDAAAGVEELRLGVDVLVLQAQQGGIPDEVQYVVGEHVRLPWETIGRKRSTQRHLISSNPANTRGRSPQRTQRARRTAATRQEGGTTANGKLQTANL
jgi:hypothetical protein